MRDLGPRDVSRAELEIARGAGEMLQLGLVALARPAPDIPPDLVLATIGSSNVLGALHAPPVLRAALAHCIT